MTNRICAAFYAWRADCRGATAVEYGLIAAGIAVTISAVVIGFGESLRDMIGNAADRVAERPE